jgi:hypothetical protein
MSHVNSPPANVLSLGAARASRGEAPPYIEAKAKVYRQGDVEPPLPPTPERLELIKAYATSSARRAPDHTASQIAQRFAPQAQAAGSRASGQTPLAPPLLALASGVRMLAAVLILVAVLPNAVLGAIIWLRLLDAPATEPAAQARQATHEAANAQIALPVLTVPATLEATDAGRIALPIALDGTDGVPAGSVIVIKGVPLGARLSSGRRSGDTDWVLDPDEIGDLHLELPDATAGEARFTIQLLAPNNGILADAVTALSITADETHELAVDEMDGEAVEAQGSAAPAELELAALPEDPASQESAAPLPESVPLPTRRPTPGADDGQAAWVRPSAYVNLRTSPSSSGAIAGVVAKGTKLRVLGRKRGWVQVANPATSQSGWIYSGNVETTP